MHHRIVVPDGVASPRIRENGPSYAQVVVATGKKLIFVAGQLARDETGVIVGKGDMEAQIRQTCKNIGLALASAGATFADVVETITFVTDIREYMRHSAVRGVLRRGAAHEHDNRHLGAGRSRWAGRDSGHRRD